MKDEADTEREATPSTPEGGEDEDEEFIARDFRSTLGSMEVNWSSCLMILVLAAVVVALIIFTRG